MTIPINTIPVLTGEVAEEFLRKTEYNSKHLAGSEYSVEKEDWCRRHRRITADLSLRLAK